MIENPDENKNDFVLIFHSSIPVVLLSTLEVVPFHAEGPRHCDVHPVHRSQGKSSWHSILLIKM